MYQTIYIDVMFIVNFAVNLLIFLSSSVIMQRFEKWWRYCVAAAFGAVYSSVVFFLNIAPLLLNISSLVIYFITCRFILLYNTRKLMFKGLIITLLCAAFYGGTIFMLYLFTGLGSVMTFNNNALYIDIPVFAMLLFCFVAYGVLWIVSRILADRSPKECYTDIAIEINGQQTVLRGFIDTGNKLSDPFSGKPIVITSPNALRKLIPEDVYKFIESEDITDLPIGWKNKVRAIPCSTVSGYHLMYAIKYDNLYIQESQLGEGLVALTNNINNNDGDFDALIPASFVNKGVIKC